MYFDEYILFLGAILLCALLSVIASARVQKTYDRFSGMLTRSGMTGFDAVSRLMRANGVHDIAIGCVEGRLSDHYHPTKAIVNLSAETYHSRSVAAVAVAAHEMGHVMQKKEGYFFYRVRTGIVPLVKIGSWIAMPIVLVGLLLDYLVIFAEEGVGFQIAMLGVILYGTSLLFTLVTYPVELDASRRAKKMLLSEGILQEDEIAAADQVLRAAAFTYFVSVLTSLVYFLRFLIYVLSIFGRRSNRR